MPDIDVNSLLGTAAGGGVVWVAIRAEIKFLWRDVIDLKKKVESLMLKMAKLEGGKNVDV